LFDLVKFGFNFMADFGISEGIALAGVISSVAAAGVGVASSVAQSNAQQQAANYNAQVAQNNATAATQQATYANQLKQIQLEQTIGKETAAAGASGIEGGSVNDVEYNSLVMGKLDQQATTYEGQIGATRNLDEAGLDSLQGANAATSGNLSALGAVVGGASKVASQTSTFEGTGAQPDYTGLGSGYYGDTLYA
jgi:hypothetical protein